MNASFVTSSSSEPARSSNHLSLNANEFLANFGAKSFAIRHHLADHPLFALPRLIELAKALPEHRVEYNAGDLAVNQKPDQTPRTGLSIAETIRRIEECRSWMVLKNVELNAEYAKLLDECLAEVLRFDHPASRGVGLREAFVFISSPGAVTPYHIDPELNFLLQIKGTKFMHVFSGDDRTLLSEEDLERFYSGAHRNLAFRDEFQAKATTYTMQPGDGVHVPVTHPHWVKVGDQSYSISFSITFQTSAAEKRSVLYHRNHRLRTAGKSPAPPGVSPIFDTWNYFCHRVARKLRTLTGRPADPKEARGY